MPNLSNTEWAYLAGIIDGEGYVGLVRQKDSRKNRGYAICYHPKIQVSMTSIETISWICNKLGGKFYRVKSKDENRKDIYCWNLERNKKNMIFVCSKLLKFSITKNRQLKKMICYSKNRMKFKNSFPGRKVIKEIDHKIYDDLRGMNFRGKIQNPYLHIGGKLDGIYS